MKYVLSFIFCMLLTLSYDVQAKNHNFLAPKTLNVIKNSDGYQILTLEKVLSGDTIIASGRIIRLWGYEAPKKGEQYHSISTKALELFLKEKLACQYMEYEDNKESVMHCLSGDTDVGALMVKSGFAKDFKEHSQGFYTQEELFARESKLGIWENPSEF